jgi:hypothetical protein
LDRVDLGSNYFNSRGYFNVINHKGKASCVVEKTALNIYNVYSSDANIAANFIADATIAGISDTVHFTDISVGSPSLGRGILEMEQLLRKRSYACF